MSTTDPSQLRAAENDGNGTRLQKTYVAVVMAVFSSILLLYACCTYYVAILTFLRANHQDVFAQLMPWSDTVAGRGAHSEIAGQWPNKSLCELHVPSKPSSVNTITTTTAELVPSTPSTTPAEDSIYNMHLNYSFRNITNCGVCNGSDTGAIFPDAIDGRQSNYSSNDSISDDFSSSLVLVPSDGERTTFEGISTSTEIVTRAPITHSTENTTAVEAPFSTSAINSSADIMNGVIMNFTTVATTKASLGINNTSFDTYGVPENYSFTATTSGVASSTGEESSPSRVGNNSCNVILVDFTEDQSEHSNAINEEDTSDIDVTTAIVNGFSNDSFNDTTSISASTGFSLTLPTIVGSIEEDPLNCSGSSHQCVLPSNKADIPSFERGRPTLIDRIYASFKNATSNTIGTSPSVDGGSEPFTISELFKYNINVSSTLGNTLASTTGTASASKSLLNVSDINAITHAGNVSTGLSSTSADVTPCNPLKRFVCDVKNDTMKSTVNTKPTVNIKQLDNPTPNVTVPVNAITDAVTKVNISTAGLIQGAPINYPSLKTAAFSLVRSVRPVTVKDVQLDYSTTNATTASLLMPFMDLLASTDTISPNNSTRGISSFSSTVPPSTEPISGNLNISVASNSCTEGISSSKGTFAVSVNASCDSPDNISVISNSSTESLLSSGYNVAVSTDTGSENPNNTSITAHTSSGVISSSCGNVLANVNSMCGNPENISIAPNSSTERISSSSGTVAESVNINCEKPNNISIAHNTSMEEISLPGGIVPESVNTSCGNPKNFAVISNSSIEGISISRGPVPVSADINYGNPNNISVASDPSSRRSSPSDTDAESSGSGVVIVPVEGSVPAQPRPPRRYPNRQHVDQLLWEMRPPSRYRP